MKQNLKISILIPDGGNPLLFNVLNCCSLIKKIEVYVMSSQKNSPYKYSRFVKQYLYYPEAKSDIEWIANINDALKEYNIEKVLPIFEKGLKILTEHANELPQEKLLKLPSLESLSIALNKGVLMEFMNFNKIQISNSVVVKPGKEFSSNSELTFPVLAKPTVETGGGVGIVKFTNLYDLSEFFKNRKFEYDYLVEEYIQGYDLCCNVLCENGKILAYTIHNGLMKGVKAFGPSVELEFLKNDEVVELTGKLMKALQWNGVANLDLRYDEVSKCFKIIEVNPRYWYNVDASAIQGVNFVYLSLLNSLDKSFSLPTYKQSKYLNINGVVKSVKQNPLFLFNVKSIFKNSQVRFALKDPLPLLARPFIKSEKIS